MTHYGSYLLLNLALRRLVKGSPSHAGNEVAFEKLKRSGFATHQDPHYATCQRETRLLCLNW